MEPFDANLLREAIDEEFEVFSLFVREENGVAKIRLNAASREAADDLKIFWMITEYPRGLLDRIAEESVRQMILTDIRAAMRFA